MYSTSRRPKEAKPNANKCLSSNDLDLQQDKETDLKYLKHLYCLWGFEENVKKTPKKTVIGTVSCSWQNCGILQSLNFRK